jgi:hypothetical protein
MPHVWNFLHSPLSPQWINVLIVAVLAEITRRYAKSTKRQADAAEAQAKAASQQAQAAMRQAEVAEHTLSIMQAQIQEQAGVAVAVLKQSIADLQLAAKHWRERFVHWGSLTSNKIELLPAQWSVAMEHARRLSAQDLYPDLTGLQSFTKQTELNIDALLEAQPANRDTFKAGEIQRNLEQIDRTCQEIGKKVGSLPFLSSP